MVHMSLFVGQEQRTEAESGHVHQEGKGRVRWIGKRESRIDRYIYCRGQNGQLVGSCPIAQGAWLSALG